MKQDVNDTDSKAQEFVYYVITVHGIGDQKYNETLLPVINGFGKVLNDTPHGKDLVTLGMVNSQTGTVSVQGNSTSFQRLSNQQVWAEFEGIPNAANGPGVSGFDGSPSTSGDNMRFVDMYWADMLESDAGVSVQPLEKWTESIIARNSSIANDPLKKTRQWLTLLLQELNKLVLFLNSILAIRYKNLHELIFNKYLSDAQVYAEHLNIRGSAVTRFHRMMEKIQETHEKEQKEIEESGQEKKESRYIIIAHSLGSVLAADALCFAAYLETQGSDADSIFPSYERKKGDGQQLTLSWLQHVQTLVTLGSPIDKYLTLWPNNYAYLQKTIKDRGSHKIRHLNYCDEQDPVGHKLNLFRATESYKGLFTSYNVAPRTNREVFNRYGVPGVAHTEYWEDLGLLDHIIKVGINQHQLDTQESLDLRDVKGAFSRGITIAYFLVPIAAMIVLSYFFITGHNTIQAWREEWLGLLGASIGFIGATYFFNRLMTILVYWRQILIAKSKDTDKTSQHRYLVYDNDGARKRVRWIRNIILIALFSVFFFVSAPWLANWPACQWQILGLYLVVLVASYFAFLFLKKLFIPATIVLKDKQNIPLVFAMGLCVPIMGLSIAYCRVTEIQPFHFMNDSIALLITIMTVVWTLACVIVKRARSRMYRMLKS